MKDIDFLPARYRERRAQQRARLYRLAMAGCVAAFVAAIAIAQQAVRRSVEQQLQLVSARYPTAMATAARTSRLRKDVAEAEAFANLYTYLQHPWPMTQVLAEISRGLPDTVTVTSIRVEVLTKAAADSLPNAPVTTSATTEENARRDYEKLRASRERVVQALRITGSSSEGRDLHAFVRKLAPSPLFKAAKLESLETVKGADQQPQSRFELQLIMRPPYGHPGASEEGIAAAKQVEVPRP